MRPKREIIPSSVYHLQVNAEFPLKKAQKLIPYLHEIGIDGICCSPLYENCGQSYAVANPNKLDPVLGSSKDYENFCSDLKKYKMQQILDVVPNHMGIKGDKNLWWLDVLEKGSSSNFADFFDINWSPLKKELSGKVLLPILNASYGHVLEQKEIILVWKNDRLWANYFDYQLPLCPSSYKEWLQNDLEAKIALHNQDSNLLHELLEKQFYRLAHWVVAGQEINYRRFFNINELVAIHIEKENVFNAHHAWIFNQLANGHAQGLRIDHPDGLYDPSQYFERLRKKNPVFIWVEKILDSGEQLPEKWDVDGTVGYDFLSVLNGVFIQKKNESRLTAIYKQFVQEEMDFEEIHYQRRKRYILMHMSSEINFLGFLFENISEKNRYFRDFTLEDLTRACLEIMACFPVYRTYIKPGKEIRKKDREYVISAIEKAKTKTPEIDTSVFNYIRGVLLLEHEFSPLEKELSIDILLRFQQVTAPVMAKGLEDSTFYIYNRLISLNEVGNDPHEFGCTKEQFHAFNKKKLKFWPLGALASSTHDSKYSEDARLRLHALSELPREWRALVFSLRKTNKKYLTKVQHILFPDSNTEYFIYQMLLILWPTKSKRLWTCLNKAIREAGCYTSWRRINKNYEHAVKHFLNAFAKNPPPAFLRFQKKLAKYGFWNSLAALVLKIGSCGIVSIYQGDELFRLSLMDPDNRRPVDFAKRKKELKNFRDLKMQITAKGLRFRREHKELFLDGDYIPLKSPNSLISFIRKWKNQEVIIITQRFFTEKHNYKSLRVPSRYQGKTLVDLFTNKKIFLKHASLPLSEIFTSYPFALLILD